MFTSCLPLFNVILFIFVFTVFYYPRLFVLVSRTGEDEVFRSECLNSLEYTLRV